MKAFFLLLPLLIINSCKTTTDTNSASQTNTTATEEVQTKVECPADGICTAEIQQSKKLIIKEDGTGALYPEISSGDNMVVIYTFSQKGPEGTVDGDYSETIHFEMPANASEVDKKGNSLQDIKLLYGKQCYCKGEAGFYKVENGSLQVTKNRNELHFELQFAVDKTSHKLSKISKTIEM